MGIQLTREGKYLVIREVNRLFGNAGSGDRFNEQTRTSQVVLVIDSEACSILWEHNILRPKEGLYFQ